LRDEDLVKRVLAGQTGAYDIIMHRYNQRLYRVALSIVKDESESEDLIVFAFQAPRCDRIVAAVFTETW